MNEFQAFTELVLNSIIVFCYCIYHIDSQLVVTNCTDYVSDLVGNDHHQTSLIVGNDGSARGGFQDVLNELLTLLLIQHWLQDRSVVIRDYEYIDTIITYATMLVRILCLYSTCELILERRK